jgi:hypothetical protein
MWIIGVLAIAVILAGWLIIYVLCGGMQRYGRRQLERCYADLNIHDALEPGDVCIKYHTYRGLVVWVAQDEHWVCGPAADAHTLLKRLLRFNLTWGLTSYGAVFIPFAALLQYYAENRSIARQQQKIESESLPTCESQ